MLNNEFLIKPAQNETIEQREIQLKKQEFIKSQHVLFITNKDV